MRISVVDSRLKGVGKPAKTQKSCENILIGQPVALCAVQAAGEPDPSPDRRRRTIALCSVRVTVSSRGRSAEVRELCPCRHYL